MDDGVPFNLGAFAIFIERINQLTPLTGRVWNSEVTITAVVRNIQATPSLFRGINVKQIDDECRPQGKKTRPAPGFYPVLRLASLVQRWVRAALAAPVPA